VSITKDEIKRLIEKHCGMGPTANLAKLDVPTSRDGKQRVRSIPEPTCLD